MGRFGNGTFCPILSHRVNDRRYLIKAGVAAYQG